MGGMIVVTVGSTTERKDRTINPNTVTPKDLLNEERIDYSTASIMLDGASVQPGDISKTFTELGIESDCMLIAVIKSDNA